MRTTGRNDPCNCGSGNRYKHCCGSFERWESINEGAREAIERARALQFQIRRQQGAGRPIVAARLGDSAIVIVGRTRRQGRWQTFPDFLFDYIRDVIGREWGQAEIGKADEAKHPIIRWYQALCLLQAKHATVPGRPWSMPMYGAARAYLGLAYDLYTIEHNEESTPGHQIMDRLLRRLRHPDQFLGARYEIRVAAMFLRAGFSLDWEDEMDGDSTHGEFIATIPETKREFWIECKIRQPDAAVSNRNVGRFVRLVSDALSKHTDKERFIFVDLNTPATPIKDKDQPDWRDWAVNKLRVFESQPAAKELPPALVMVTNYPDHHHLEETVPDAGGAIEGFKVPDYRAGAVMSLSEAIDRRARNPEVETLLRSMAEHRDVPNTFDGSIPGLDDAPDRLVMGRAYQVGEYSGVLVEACVIEDQRAVAAFLQREDGTQIGIQLPLSDLEMDAWRRYPETFFGLMRDPQQPVTSALELYDFFFRSHHRLTRDELIARLAEHYDTSMLDQKTLPELTRFLAERMTESALSRSDGFPVPTWVTRMRRPPSQRQD